MSICNAPGFSREHFFSIYRMKTILCYDLGMAPYKKTWELQKAIQKNLIDEKLHRRSDNNQEVKAFSSAAQRKPVESLPDISHTVIDRKNNDVLLLVEHPHVYTLGKSGDAAHLLRNESELHQLGATYEKIDRGGDITYHGPGQIVGYPILDLDYYFTDIHKYLRLLEEVIILTCSDYGINAGRIEKLTGVWVNGAKICAFGIKCSRWVTMHGFALNVNSRLDYFNHIIPCGISDKTVCSMSSLLGKSVDEKKVKERILHHFETLFGVTIVQMEDQPLKNFDNLV